MVKRIAIQLFKNKIVKFQFCETFIVSQHFLHNCPSIFHFGFGLYLMKPIFFPQFTQKFILF